MGTVTQDPPTSEAVEAPDVEEGFDPFPTDDLPEPGEQGIATQDEEAVEEYEPPEPGPDELKLADEVYEE